jgi:hypothetical protein
LGRVDIVERERAAFGKSKKTKSNVRENKVKIFISKRYIFSIERR